MAIEVVIWTLDSNMSVMFIPVCLTDVQWTSHSANTRISYRHYWQIESKSADCVM